jgi:hypothetical protein
MNKGTFLNFGTALAIPTVLGAIVGGVIGDANETPGDYPVQGAATDFGVLVGLVIGALVGLLIVGLVRLARRFRNRNANPSY